MRSPIQIHFISSLLENEPHQRRSPPAELHRTSFIILQLFLFNSEGGQSEVNVPVAVFPVRTRRSELRFGRSGSGRGAAVRPHRFRLFSGLSSVFRLLVLSLRSTGFMRPCRGVGGSCRWLSTASLLVHLHRLRLFADITPAGFTLQPDWGNILEVKSTETQKGPLQFDEDTQWGGSDLFCLKK